MLPGAYQFVARDSGRYLDVADESSANGAKVMVWHATGGANQTFEVAKLNSGYYTVMALHSGKSLDVWNQSTAAGAEIRQYSYNGGNHQQWQFSAAGGGYHAVLSRLNGYALTAVEGYIRLQPYTGAANQQWHMETAMSRDYQLVWSDEFNYQGLPDTSFWSYEQGLVRNSEAQYYTVARPQNIDVRNGLLTITAQRESYQNATYTSASLHTRGKLDWTYGRFEMRARIDTRPGLWPAFWMLGGGKWPEGGEIDIMEFYQNKILANVAWKADNSDPWSAAWDSSTRSLTTLRTEDAGWSDQFHVWRMDWDSRQIRLYVDDLLMNSTDLDSTINPDGSNPFRDRPFYILINLAVGGTNGGNPTNTSFPAKYEIDYVRVYQ